jgi:hypothetical protein
VSFRFHKALGTAPAAARNALLAGVCLVGLSGCNALESAYLNWIETTDFTVDGSDLLVEGVINSRSLNSFNAVIADAPQVQRLVLLEVPGSVDDDTNLALGHRVRDLGLDTHLTADSEVHSGGTDLFLSGVRRSMEDGAIMGVHSWGEGNLAATDFPKDDPIHSVYVDYMERMLGDGEFYWFTIEAAPVEDTHALTRAEIQRFGILTEPVIQ